MGKEFRPDPNFVAWGPWIKDDYYIQPVMREDMIVAGVIFGLSMSFAILAIVYCTKHTRQSSRGLKSPFIWMIWIELAVCIIIAIEVLVYLLKLVRPSFYFFMSVLFNWSIQVQLLLQIIINRIRVIIPNRKRGKQIMISVAIFVTLINISVFCVWMPARLQINKRYILVNEYWDRIEKFLFFVIDGILNWYFVKVVRENLVKNGLEKYHRLVRFNQRIIFISLFMDIALIAAMSTPNGFVYAMFHPLAYLVKLNIELSMASLIKRIATSNQSHRERAASFIDPCE